MGYKLYKFRELAEMELHLNGAVFGSDSKKGFPIAVGMALKFLLPAAITVTFTAGAVPGQLTYIELKTQIEAAAALVRVTILGDRIAILEKTPSLGVQIDSLAHGSTANQYLGMDLAGVTGRVYMYPDGVSAAVPPHYITSYFAEGHYTLVVKE